MKYMSRREFLTICAGTAAALGVAGTGWPGLAEAARPLAGGNPPVLWLRGSGCGGCSTSMMNTAGPGLKELLTELVGMSWHPGFVHGAGATLVEELMKLAETNKDKFILVVEGAIPKGADGRFHIMGRTADGRSVTLIELVQQLGRKARYVIAAGTCAAYGGIPAAAPNLMGCVRLENLLELDKVLNVPGCPPHPDWVVATLLHAALYGKPETDDFGRPRVFYGGLIHNNCPRRQHFDNSIFAGKFGEDGCLLELGCKGPLTHGDCPTRLWNRGRNWCVGGEGPCTGCTEPSFPQLMMPFYSRMPDISGPGIRSTADAVGIAMGAAAGLGLAAHLAGSILSGRVGSRPGRHSAKPAAGVPAGAPESTPVVMPDKDGEAR